MKLQKTKRIINWDIYLAAFVISAVIFGIGVWVGIQIEKNISESLSKEITATRQRIVELETMMLFEQPSNFCPFFMEEMEKFDRETAEFGSKIGYMEEHKGIDPKLKSDYMLLELRDYFLIKKIDSICGSKTNIALYFIDSSSRNDCRLQGDELTKAREKTNLRVYTFDVSVNNTAVEIFRKSFNISIYPTIIINGKKYEKFMKAEEIINSLK
jgi:hypothetical protein